VLALIALAIIGLKAFRGSVRALPETGVPEPYPASASVLVTKTYYVILARS
jgi:hypothetical protein